jgi:hypothetical protein
MIGFGLDLAGYTTGKTCLAIARWDGNRVDATLLSNSVFSANKKFPTNAQTASVIEQEVRTLKRCLKLGPVAVDVPIDLQNLLAPDQADYLWELTLRPIDKALGAMCALADRIGSPLSRFRAIMHAGKLGDSLGHSLFETYPEGTWRLNKIKSKGYKGTNGGDACRALCAKLNVAPTLSNDDALDAVIAAATAAADANHLVHESEYAEVLRCLGGDKQYELPRGYRLLKPLPKGVKVEIEDFETWLRRQGAS